ncbi:TetR/AcrR family transcriptional regulator [Fodinicola acaciae]|uniref:TetR/AcrR family transcriptional regulator n=1 Tax=Fodinicola acaciae TaxID=2681555 RepID=UPI001C9E93AC|nr:TetR family transcriptional regulator [Fodinicola acaciae]
MPDLTPNQLAKRQQIVDAARLVLARDGLAGCTARAVADASPLTKSAIHYYFADMDDLIDQAMAGHIDAFVANLRAAAARQDAAADRFWAAVRDYVETFRQQPGVLRLWFAYWISATTKNRLTAIETMHDSVAGIFAELLTDIGVDDPARRADELFSFLLGEVVRSAVTPRSFDELRARITDICAIS